MKDFKTPTQHPKVGDYKGWTGPSSPDHRGGRGDLGPLGRRPPSGMWLPPSIFHQLMIYDSGCSPMMVTRSVEVKRFIETLVSEPKCMTGGPRDPWHVF